MTPGGTLAGPGPVSLSTVAAALGCSPFAASRRLLAGGYRRVAIVDACGIADRLYVHRDHQVAAGDVAGPATHLRHLLWNALAAATGPRQLVTLTTEAAVPRALAAKLLAAWERHGLVVSTTHQPPRYQLHPDTDPAIMPPTTSTERTDYDRIWAAIRVLRRFDVPTLITIAKTSRRWTQVYVGQLQRAGYLAIHRPAVRRAGICAVYQLTRDTGRAAPRPPASRSAGVAADGGVG